MIRHKMQSQLSSKDYLLPKCPSRGRRSHGSTVGARATHLILPVTRGDDGRCGGRRSIDRSINKYTVNADRHSGKRVCATSAFPASRRRQNYGRHCPTFSISRGDEFPSPHVLQQYDLHAVHRSTFLTISTFCVLYGLRISDRSRRPLAAALSLGPTGESVQFESVDSESFQPELLEFYLYFTSTLYLYKLRTRSCQN